MLRSIPAAASFTFASRDALHEAIANVWDDVPLVASILYPSFSRNVAGWEHHFTIVPESKHRDRPRMLAARALALHHRINAD